MTRGTGRGPGPSGLVSFALAIALLSLVTSISPGESWRNMPPSGLTRPPPPHGPASHRRVESWPALAPSNPLGSATKDSEQATGSSLASGPAAPSSVGTVYPPSTRFSPQGPYLAGSVLIGFHSGVSAA